ASEPADNTKEKPLALRGDRRSKWLTRVGSNPFRAIRAIAHKKKSGDWLCGTLYSDSEQGITMPFNGTSLVSIFKWLKINTFCVRLRGLILRDECHGRGKWPTVAGEDAFEMARERPKLFYLTLDECEAEKVKPRPKHLKTAKPLTGVCGLIPGWVCK